MLTLTSAVVVSTFATGLFVAAVWFAERAEQRKEALRLWMEARRREDIEP